MSASDVYCQVRNLLDGHLPEQVDESSRQRMALLVTGMIRAKSASPSRIAEALGHLGLTDATTESIERRIRRIENDPELDVTLCFHPFAKQRLILGNPQELFLILDPTTQEDRVVMLCASVWYQGRALPLAWMVWPANQPLTGERFWQRVEALLDTVLPLLPVGVSITWTADRAFGTPRFTDLVTARAWHFVVRVQGQTLCQDKKGFCCYVEALVLLPGQRKKLRGKVFKKCGWRTASVVVYWGQRYATPLCLVSDLPPRWTLIHTYRRRYPIEATFRHYKSFGWHWEQGQVTNLEHMQRLLVGMALATWIVLGVGTKLAQEHLAKPPTGRRRTMPWIGKRSLFHLGLDRLHEWLGQEAPVTFCWQLTGWSALNWSQQIHFHHARAFVFASRTKEVTCSCA